MFKRILIANRGEIALRVIRACAEMGIASIAVYTPVDSLGLWIRKADEAYELQGPDGREGYLNLEAILKMAQKTKADAIHPGYGFLAEQPALAEACAKKGITFIGPSPRAMEKAGHKTKARQIAAKKKIPLVPGSKPLASPTEAQKKAPEIGFPLLLKACAGGGGRGMRLVHSKEEIKPAYESASREALASFGDGRLYLEKFVEKPRHIEIQVLADYHQQAVYLGERECSIQRRYQKLIEESPSPFMDEKLRKKMGEAALLFVRECRYTNAGTVEFLVDQNKNFYFLEMNARIQVEHPVTELTTGIDLVKAQIQLAAGEKLSIRQEEIKRNGWAFEARINCEDPYHDFLPVHGKITHLEFPGGPGVRVDTALYSGYTIPSQFDSLIAKLLSWGKNREEALARTIRALREFQIAGIPTTIPFHLKTFSHPNFQSGKFSTNFIPQHAQEFTKEELSKEETDAAALIAALQSQLPSKNGQTEIPSSWKRAALLENIETHF